ncbi:unnamed protein product [Ceratitis capitata]|uniref:Cysteine-rich DPF motif domain-containing protein 1 n=1 Tax=Ceratitis capitata TaxID=7213 RepID=A0A811U8Y8_CERCA|nr:unnamed protein product [Ceratitis capitata]
MDGTEAFKESLDNNEDVQLNVKNEEEEIAVLEAEANCLNSEKQEAKFNERVPNIDFQCGICDMTESVHYYGKRPPFLYGLQLLEDSFVMRDPFQPPPLRWKPKSEYFVVIGAKCSVCQKIVCKGTECSFYYTCTYCLNCAKNCLDVAPTEVQAKLRKQLEQDK